MNSTETTLAADAANPSNHKSLTVRPEVHAAARAHCKTRGLKLSDFASDAIRSALGIPSVRNSENTTATA